MNLYFPGKEALFHFYDPRSVEDLYTTLPILYSQLYSYQLDEAKSEGEVRYSIQLSERLQHCIWIYLRMRATGSGHRTD